MSANKNNRIRNGDISLNKRIEDYVKKLQEQVGERLKNERIRLGIKLNDFAEKLEIHRNTQRNYENGKRSPDEKYYKKIANLGVNIFYVLNESKIDEFPYRAGSIAELVFSSYSKAGFIPGAMRGLFTILGSNMLRSEVVKGGTGLSQEDIDKLIKLAIERGEVFDEAYSAITYYTVDLFSENAWHIENYILYTKLIFKVVSLYDEVKNQFAHASLHDNIRLVAQQVVKSHGDLEVKKE